MYLLNLEFSLIHRAERVKDQQQKKTRQNELQCLQRAGKNKYFFRGWLRHPSPVELLG